MPATPQTVLIPFVGGLDTYTNPQLLKPGSLTAATGAMLDRPGSAYPGPGFTPAQWVPTTGNTWQNHGLGALNHGPNTNNDQLVFWATQPGGSGPGVSNAGDASTTPTQQRLAPWRQVTQRVTSDSQTYLNAVYGSMAGPPQTAVCGNYVMYAWLATASGYVIMTIQDLTNHAFVQGPYYLSSAYGWTNTATPLTVSKMALTSDGTYFRLLVLSGTTPTYAAYLATSPLTLAGSTGTFAGTYNNIDACGTGDESTSGYGVFIAYDSANDKIVGKAFNSTATAPGALTNLVTGCSSTHTRPITCNPIRTQGGASTGFLFMGMNGSNQPLVTTTTLSLGSVTQTTVTASLYSGGSIVARALSITNTVSGSGATVAMALETVPDSAARAANWNDVVLATVTLASPGTAVSSTYVAAWGGAALLGKFYPWYDGVDFRPLIPLRTGWWHLTGTWGTLTAAGTGTFAYPNGYLYDHLGSLYARFGDADVGTDSLWPAFDAAGYVGSSLQPVPSGFQFSLASGQQTLSYAWPQMGYYDFVSTRAADSGSPIGSRCGLSLVSWLAPTASEPPAQPVQFGNELIIPGTITAVYDGANVFECGFFHRAPAPIVTSNGGGGSLPNSTTYYYQSVMVYQDKAGRIHYSAPSLRVSITTTVNNDLINITQWGPRNQTLRNNSSFPVATPIAVQIYRSTGGHASTDSFTMYLNTTIHAIPGSGNSAVTDTVLDANLTQCPAIYTDGQSAGASTGTDAPPPFDSITVWNNQVWGIANRNGPELWCTWPLDDAQLLPEGPTWSSQNTVAVPAEVGQPKALRGLDEKLILLGTRADYGLIGSAPARSEALTDNPTFSAPLLIPTPGGIRVLNGAVRIPDGLLFQGSHGFMLLGRDLTYKPVGNPVNDFTHDNLYLPGVFLPEQQAVLFFSASDVTQNLVYFYGTGEWSQVEQPPADSLNTAAASVIVSAVRTSAGVAPKVYVLPSTGSYYCSVDSYSKYLAFRTPWIELTDLTPAKGIARGVAGYGILREVHVLGTLPDGFPGAQTLTLYTEYDYENNTTQLPETQSLDLTSGSQAALSYQWRFGFAQGQCARVRFTVTVDGGLRTSNGSDAPTVLLTGLMLSYDVDMGLTRLGPNNSTGT